MSNVSFQASEGTEHVRPHNKISRGNPDRRYQETVAVYGVEPVELITGALPLRQQRLVEAWAELHRDELMQDWQLLQEGRRPQPIAPLQ